MKPRHLIQMLLLTFIALALAGCIRRAGVGDVPGTPVNYYVHVSGARPDRFDVALVIDHVRSDSVDFYLPRWLPGQSGRVSSMSINNFVARGGDGAAIPARRIAEGHWRLYPDGERYVTIGYHVVNPEAPGPLALSPRIDERGGYAPGGRLFGFLDGHQSRPVTVSFELPAEWSVVTTLESSGPHRFAAPAYAALPGALFVVGDRYREYKLFVEGRPHDIVVEGVTGQFSPDSLLTLVEETVVHGARFFGRPAYDRYLVVIRFVEPGREGIGAAGQAGGAVFVLPMIDDRRIRSTGLGRTFLHQYLHAWYPGRFGPASLMAPDFRRRPEIEEAWLIEGVAEYYARLLPERYADGPGDFYDAIGELLTWWSELEGDGRVDVTTLGGPDGDENSSARRIVGGALAAFVVDLAIRGDTRGARGLDDLLYYLQRHGTAPGYDEDVWRRAARELGIPEAALSPLIEGSPLSIRTGLARAGLRVSEIPERRRTLGARLLVDPSRTFVVREIDAEGTAASAGLRDGDRVIKINGTPIGPDETVATRYALTNYIRENRTGAPIAFEIVRDGETIELRGTVRERQVTRVRLEEIAEASVTALIVRRSLFRPSSTGGQ